jgi:hypothetical protein
VIVAKQERRHEDRDAGSTRSPGWPPPRWAEFRDRGVHDGGAWGTGRGLKAREGAPGAGPFRDERHGGDPAAEDDEYGQSYVGPMRAYRGTTRGYRAEPRAHADGEPSVEPRPDQNVLEDVVDLLARDRGVDDDRIQAYVEDGVVRLEGHTCSRRSKQRAERLAKLVAGVTGVQNRLRIVVRSA